MRQGRPPPHLHPPSHAGLRLPDDALSSPLPPSARRGVVAGLAGGGRTVRPETLLEHDKKRARARLPSKRPAAKRTSVASPEGEAVRSDRENALGLGAVSASASEAMVVSGLPRVCRCIDERERAEASRANLAWRAGTGERMGRAAGRGNASPAAAGARARLRPCSPRPRPRPAALAISVRDRKPTAHSTALQTGPRVWSSTSPTPVSTPAAPGPCLHTLPHRFPLPSAPPCPLAFDPQPQPSTSTPRLGSSSRTCPNPVPSALARRLQTQMWLGRPSGWPWTRKRAAKVPRVARRRKKIPSPRERRRRRGRGGGGRNGRVVCRSAPRRAAPTSRPRARALRAPLSRRSSRRTHVRAACV